MGVPAWVDWKSGSQLSADAINRRLSWVARGLGRSPESTQREKDVEHPREDVRVVEILERLGFRWSQGFRTFWYAQIAGIESQCAG
jgi:hypothetical protein